MAEIQIQPKSAKRTKGLGRPDTVGEPSSVRIMKAAAATDIARDGEDVGGPHIASARRASGCEDHRTNNAELCDVSPLRGPLAPSAYFFRQANPTRARNPANSVLIQSTFVRVCCPTATTLARAIKVKPGKRRCR